MRLMQTINDVLGMAEESEILETKVGMLAITALLVTNPGFCSALGSALDGQEIDWNNVDWKKYAEQVSSADQKAMAAGKDKILALAGESIFNYLQTEQIDWPSLPRDLGSAIEQFEALQAQFRKAGAEDTEPCQVFHRIIHKAIDGESVDWAKINWQLYSNSDEAEQRNLALTAIPLLTAAAMVVYEKVVKYNDSRSIVSDLRDFAWR